jgi:hypothetical protein
MGKNAGKLEGGNQGVGRIGQRAERIGQRGYYRELEL